MVNYFTNTGLFAAPNDSLSGQFFQTDSQSMQRVVDAQGNTIGDYDPSDPASLKTLLAQTAAAYQQAGIPFDQNSVYVQDRAGNQTPVMQLPGISAGQGPAQGGGSLGSVPPPPPPNPPSVPTTPYQPPTVPTVPYQPTVPTSPVQSITPPQPTQSIPGQQTGLTPGDSSSMGPMPGFPTTLPGMGMPASTPPPGQSAYPTPLPGNIATPPLPPPEIVQTPQLPTIAGLTTPTTPVNQPTVTDTDISKFIPTTSQQQQDIVNQGIAQSQGVANQDFQQLQSLIGPYIQQQFSQYTDPNSSQYRSTIGQLNNMGVANGGAFPQALADKLAPLISQGAMTLGQEALVPGFANQQSLVNQGAVDQSQLGLDPLQRFIEQQNFTQQQTLANQLADKGASAQFGSGVGGLLGGGLGAAAGGAFGGIPGAMIGGMIGGQGGKAVGSGGVSWICGHLKNMGLVTEDELRGVHERLYPSIFKHPIHWLHYLLCAPRLITLCDQAGIPWDEVKKVLIDAVLAEPDTEKSWQIYRAECQRLTLRYAPELWQLEAFQW